MDIPALMNLARTAHRASRFAHVPIDEAQAKRAWLEAVNTPAAAVFVKEQDGQVVGCIAGLSGQLYHCLGVAIVVEQFWFVLPGTSGRAAIGLLKRLEQWAEDTYVACVVRISTNDAIRGLKDTGRLWDRMGYRQSGSVYGKEIGI